MRKLDTSELEKIVIGRVVPHIYSFVTNTLPNYLKVGDTYRPVEERLSEWRKHYKDLQEVSRHNATVGDQVFFRDYAVHKYLRQNGIDQVPLDISKNVRSDEFFENAKKADVSDAITDIVQNYQKTDIYKYYDNTRDRVEYHYKRTFDFEPRQNQQDAINAFGSAIKQGRTNLLMYAVMRFGKSITSMWSAKSIDSKLTVVVSAKADVRSEWKQTVESHKDFTGYRFIDKDDLKQGVQLSDLYGKEFKTGGKFEVCTNLVLFLTLQDLAGSSNIIKNHHKILKSAHINLLIIDETHFGARAQVLGKILAGVPIEESEKKALNDDKEDPINLGSLNKLDAIRADFKLHLSGTPYRILMGSEFEQEDIISFVQFSDIYEAKLKWSSQHLDENEWKNPYYGFPQMVRFAFNPNESSRKKLATIPGSKPAELFTPISVKNSGDYEKFVHEKEVTDLLLVLDGSKNDTNILGLLDNDTIKAGKLARHIVIVLPFRASCDAFQVLINRNEKLFKNLAEYELLNVSGYNQNFSSPEEIKSAITKAESEHKKTITLTVNKMLTGTTVPQWDTMIYLKGTSSPQEYDQAIFRLQSPWIEKYIDIKDKNEDVVEYDMKPQTLLVDLDPTRLFHLQERKAFVYGANIQKIGNENIEDFIKRELEISPIIVLNAEGNKLVEVTATTIIDEVRKYSSNRTIVEDVEEIGIDMSLKNNPIIFDLISKFEELSGKGGLNIKPNEGEGEELGTSEPEDQISEVERDFDQIKQKSSDDSDNSSSFGKRLKTYYVLILFFAFLSTTEDKSLTDIIKNIEINENNRRIASNLGLRKVDLELIRNSISPSILSSLDYKIQNLGYRAKDKSITPVEHIDTAIHKFGSINDTEVFTPASIVNQMYDSFDEVFWHDARNVKLLDIASKSGSFAKGYVERSMQYGISKRDIKDNFYSIPTSSAAYEFTRKMYEALGLNVDNIAKYFNSFDLTKLDDNKVRYLLSQKKKFCDIALTDLEGYTDAKGERTSMKFTAIVGNPPYQENTGTNFAKPIYHLFFEYAKALNPNYITLIHPGRFLMNAGATPKEWNTRMLNDPHLTIPIYEPDPEKIFAGVDITGAIAVTFWDKNRTDGGLGGVFVASEELRSILKKVKSGGFDKIVGSRGETKLKIVLDLKYPHDLRIAPNYFDRFPNIFFKVQDSKHEIKIIGLEKGNKRTVRYISQEIVTDPKLKKWKVFVPKSNGSGAIGEVMSTSLIGQPLLGEPNVGCTYTFLQIGSFDNKKEAENCLKYIKSRFCRVMLGVLKVTQDNPKSVWKNVPLQDFTKKSDIDWSKSISEIDRQLYKKYGLSNHEINFIETRVKAMD
jgi:superfamily II DNA or RNA helicase